MGEVSKKLEAAYKLGIKLGIKDSDFKGLKQYIKDVGVLEKQLETFAKQKKSFLYQRKKLIDLMYSVNKSAHDWDKSLDQLPDDKQKFFSALNVALNQAEFKSSPKNKITELKE